MAGLSRSGFSAYRTEKDYSKHWLEQKSKFLHLALFQVKTGENGLKSGAKVWCKTPLHFWFLQLDRCDVFPLFSTVSL